MMNILKFQEIIIMSKKNIIRTSAKVASKAAKVLTSNNSTKTSKSIAGSALTNRKPKK